MSNDKQAEQARQQEQARKAEEFRKIRAEVVADMRKRGAIK